jgi:hypothetical protein
MLIFFYQQDEHDDRMKTMNSYNPNLSPTALLVAIASDFRDAAMKDAYEAEGTDREAEADAAYDRALAAYRAAREAHRAACEANGDSWVR